MKSIQLSKLSRETQARIRTELAAKTTYEITRMTVAEQEVEKALKKFLDSLIKEVKITEKIVPVQSYSIRDVKEGANGEFKAEVFVKPDSYLPGRFIKGVLKDVKSLLEEWAAKNLDAKVNFNIYSS